MTSRLRAIRNYIKHAHEDRTFRLALALAFILAVLAAGHIAAQARPVIVTLDGSKCYPRATGWAMCQVPLPDRTDVPKGTENH